MQLVKWFNSTYESAPSTAFKCAFEKMSLAFNEAKTTLSLYFQGFAGNLDSCIYLSPTRKRFKDTYTIIFNAFLSIMCRPQLNMFFFSSSLMEFGQ